ncbi:MAG: chromosome segregation protein SMC [Nitrospiraceae bacterium]
MYLKSLEILGFKSFAEAKIQFPEGITAIVGPNGSGKSNVVDGILWVLGEQSTKTLRSERMEDIIFNGTEFRKPLGMSEISLIIGGLADLRLDVVAGMPSQLGEYQELMITRRLYRNGDSEYLINKTACRLKDIRSVLLETRAGTKGHTVIEQGRIDQILNASPQDRRELIEETAGIVRYKKQKAEALRKLESTQQNLLRVRDIIAEVRKQLHSLERQARQARSFQALQREARSLEIELLSRDYRSFRAALETVESEAHALEAQETAYIAEQARQSAEQEASRLRVTSMGETISRVREELGTAEQRQGQALSAAQIERSRIELNEQQKGQTDQELERLTGERQQANLEMEQLQGRLAQLEGEITEQETSYRDLEEQTHILTMHRASALAEEERGRLDVFDLAVLVANTEQTITQLSARTQEVTAQQERAVREHEDFARQLALLSEQQERLMSQRLDVEQRITSLTDRKKEVQFTLAQTTDRIAELDQQVTRQAEDFAATVSRFAALQGVVREEMGYGREGEEDNTAVRACKGVRDALAEWLEIPPGLDRAVEAVLGERVRGWLVDDPAVASHAVEFLKGRELGRGAFIPQQLRRQQDEAATTQTWWAAIAQESGVIGRVVDLVRAQGQAHVALNHLFDGLVVVENLEVGRLLWERYPVPAPFGPTFVTLLGETIDAAGMMIGGGTSVSGGLLQRRREVLELESRRNELELALRHSRQLRDQSAARAAALREEDQRMAEALRESEMLELSLHKDIIGMDQQRSDLQQRAETLANDLAAGRDEQARMEQALLSGRGQLTQWIGEKSGQEATLVRVRARLNEVERDMLAMQRRLTEARLAVEGLRSQREHGKADVERLRQREAEAETRITALEQQLTTLMSAIEESRQECGRQDRLCLEFGEIVHGIKAELVSVQEQQVEEMDVVRKLDQALTGTRQAMSSVRDSRLAVEVRRAEIKTHLSTLEGTFTGTYQMDAATLMNPAVSDPTGEALSEEPDEAKAFATEGLRAQLQKVRERLDRMGAINLASIDEHRELDERYRFLTTQEQDLSNSIGSLKEIIQRINRTTKEMFISTFNELQQKFGEVFTKFFPGGRAELQLVEEAPEEGSDQEMSREPGVEIVAQPPGKRLKNITMLSGGEKTLTAMALLFASFLIRPTPFCILDEIDAPLDEENIERFTAVLRELSRGAQFLIITHNKRTMAMADSLFGVTMEEPGISKLISVKLADGQLV